jgi:hypothetical protein
MWIARCVITPAVEVTFSLTVSLTSGLRSRLNCWSLGGSAIALALIVRFTTFELDSSVGCAVVLAQVALACASTALTPIVRPGRLIFGCETTASDRIDGGAPGV